LGGGESGKAALVPGQPHRSLLYVAVTRQNRDLVMPPKENDRLSARQVEWLRQWIAAGAPWPQRSPSPPNTLAQRWDSPDGVVVRTSGGRTPEWTNRRY